VQATIERYGRVDVLVANVGINPVVAPLAELDLGVMTKVLDTNVVSSLGWIQAVHHAWMRTHGGRVVIVSSAAGYRTVLGSGAYAVSKAALIHMTRQLAAELAPGVRVNAIAPAVIRTSMNARHIGGREEDMSRAYPLQRLGESKDVAAAAAFLASDDAGWITGETLLVDGGLLAAGGILE